MEIGPAPARSAAASSGVEHAEGQPRLGPVAGPVAARALVRLPPGRHGELITAGPAVGSDAGRALDAVVPRGLRAPVTAALVPACPDGAEAVSEDSLHRAGQPEGG